MKNIKPIYLCFALLLISNTIHAQFLKKLEKRVKAATEELVLRKTVEETSKQTEKAIDTILKNPKSNNEQTNNPSRLPNQSKDAAMEENMLEDYLKQQEAISLPESFSFEWKYVLKMESDAYKKQQKEMGDSKITYLLSTQSTAFATQFDVKENNKGLGQSLMVMDPKTGINVMLMEIDGKKMIQNLPSIAEVSKQNNETIDNSNNIKIKKIGTKKIMGYSCQGFEMQLEEGVSTIYINPNSPVSFNRSGDPNFTAKGFDAEWLEDFENGLMMEMTFVSSKKAKHNMKMTCVELVRKPITINLNEYKSFMEMGK